MSLDPSCTIGKIHSVALGRMLSHWWDAMWDFQGRRLGEELKESWSHSLLLEKHLFPLDKAVFQRDWLEDISGAVSIVELVCTLTVFKLLSLRYIWASSGYWKQWHRGIVWYCICRRRGCCMCCFFESWDKMLPAPNLKKKKDNACRMLNWSKFRALVSQATVIHV